MKSELLNILGSIVALFLVGGFATFFMVLNYWKDKNK